MLVLKMEKKDTVLLVLCLSIAFLIVSGLLTDGFIQTVEGFIQIQLHPARLINDFIEIAGIGGALLNASIVGIIGIFFVLLAKIPFSGPTFATIFTMTGFGLFGKTPLNILPIIFGVFLSAKFVKKQFKDYLIIALFGTALGPLVSTIAWELGLPIIPALFLSTLAGIFTGFLLPSLAFSMLNMHKGYNLYNMGLTCGFFGLFASAIIKGFGHSYENIFYWSTEKSLLLSLLIPLISLFLLLWGILKGGKQSLANLNKVLLIPGRLPSDFIESGSISGTFINMGLIGLISSLYLWLIDAPFNGPVIGGLLTIMGFGAFGTHIKNAWPIVSGVLAASLVTGKPLNSPGPVLAAIFSTTLSPLAGEFGVFAGFTAGFLHLLIVLQSGEWHGAMNLYNNGFAGGLTATLIISVIQWNRTNKKEF